MLFSPPNATYIVFLDNDHEIKKSEKNLNEKNDPMIFVTKQRTV